jgi:hypothetical protein
MIKKIFWFLLFVSCDAIADQRLADQYGRTFGYIRQRPDGKQVIQDQYGKTYGSFNPKYGSNGATMDKYGRRIGTGNQLLLLLPPKDKKLSD